MVAEKYNFFSNWQHNFAKGKVISKCKNDKLLKKLNRKSASPTAPPPSPPFKKACPAPYFHPFS